MIMYEYMGKRMNLREIAKMNDVNYSTFKNRVERGLTIEEALHFKGTHTDIPYEIYKDGELVYTARNQSEVARYVNSSTSSLNNKLSLLGEIDFKGYHIVGLEPTQKQIEFARKWDEACARLKNSGADLSKIKVKPERRRYDYILD